MPIGQNFPIDDYYRENILDAFTISRKGKWWSAVLLIQDPQAKKPFIIYYKWNKRGYQWKKSSSFRCNSKKDVTKLLEATTTFSKAMVD